LCVQISGSCAISPARDMEHESFAGSRSLLTLKPDQYTDTRLIHKHALKETNTRTHTRTCTFQHNRETYSWVVSNANPYAHTQMHTYTHAYKVYIHTHTHTHTRTHTHAHKYTHTHTHTRAHTRTRTAGNAELRPTFLTNKIIHMHKQTHPLRAHTHTVDPNTPFDAEFTTDFLEGSGGQAQTCSCFFLIYCIRMSRLSTLSESVRENVRARARARAREQRESESDRANKRAQEQET